MLVFNAEEGYYRSYKEAIKRASEGGETGGLQEAPGTSVVN